MRRNHLEHTLDLRSAHIDSALHPHHLEPFLARAVETAQRIKRFEYEWRRPQQAFPRMKDAWRKDRYFSGGPCPVCRDNTVLY